MRTLARRTAPGDAAARRRGRGCLTGLESDAGRAVYGLCRCWSRWSGWWCVEEDVVVRVEDGRGEVVASQEARDILCVMYYIHTARPPAPIIRELDSLCWTEHHPSNTFCRPKTPADAL
ncbi:uncharacterized protein BDZ99DRAFT_154294 [Mytilinidion resinicola]|uniref:Uncharacterized protein n=1 Tax=Mytilinidion resinicola TaxID=574789 RepID=A0A6A6Y6R0_9PEZI|nr:uncharacterized protein BDZ99DRAFT_154294 [Mytilinidion resinicola]KAF2804289.1 hypothetical protein BDZ99DRAFT_154294 [Mytilinidion resinicola]